MTIMQSFFTTAGATVAAPGSISYTTAGTYNWKAPAGVTSVSVVAIGGGGAGAQSTIVSTGIYYGIGGTGGGLGYVNNYPVTPGSCYTVVVGAGGTRNPVGVTTASPGCNSYFVSTGVTYGGGGQGGRPSYCQTTPNSASTFGGTGGGAGGAGIYGGSHGSPSSPFRAGSGGGGAGGYSGSGGSGAYTRTGGSAGSGSGGGAGGGLQNDPPCGSGAGGGVGILGQGPNGAGGSVYGRTNAYGRGGSSGSNGGLSTHCACPSGVPFYPGGGYGGAYGGGGGGGVSCRGGCCNPYQGTGGSGAGGAVRIIWPGNTRSFPSTSAGTP